MTQKDLRLIFYALSDDIRLEIVRIVMLKKEVCVCSFMSYFNMSQPRISFHLRILKNASILKARKESKWTYYSLNENNEIIGVLKKFILEDVKIKDIDNMYCEVKS